MAQKQEFVFSVKHDEGLFVVYRNDEPLKTPRGLTFSVPTKQLAEAIAEECKGQGEKLDLRHMPQTQMALTAIDISSHHRDEVIEGIVRYAGSELVCQRAEDPADLVARQNEVWQPYLEWCQSKFNITLRTGSGIIPFEQKPEAVMALADFVKTYDAFPLTGISEAVGTLGSIVLGLAFVTGHSNIEEVIAAAECDQRWQAQKWGKDPVNEGREQEIRRDLGICDRWFKLLG